MKPAIVTEQTAPAVAEAKVSLAPSTPSRLGKGPTAGSFKPGDPRINRNGRPRAGLALAERGRARLDPDKILDLAEKVLNDDKIPPAQRLAMLMPIIDRCYQKPPAMSEIDATVREGESSLPATWSTMSAQERLAHLELMRRNHRVPDEDEE